MAHFGISPDDIYGWDLPQEQRKPNPYPLAQIMTKHRLEPSQLLVVDDMLPGVEMARKAGVPVAFAGWSKTEAPSIAAKTQILCDYAFYSPKDLEAFLFEPLDNRGIIP